MKPNLHTLLLLLSAVVLGAAVITHVAGGAVGARDAPGVEVTGDPQPGLILGFLTGDRGPMDDLAPAAPAPRADGLVALRPAPFSAKG
ncbi:MAG: hypothetical protein OIF47_17835 [Marinibacterium sp.]|nr:hypothetical protein [Marinibacterium sp.]